MITFGWTSFRPRVFTCAAVVGLATSTFCPVAPARAASLDQLTRINLLNPAAIGPGTKAGELDTVLSKLRCASSPEALKNCSPEIRQTTLQGITADGAAAAVITLQTNAQVALPFTITNEVTLVQYDPNFRSYPPMAGSTSITLQPSQFQNCNGQPCVEQIVQAPDYTKPVTLTVTGQGVTPAQAQVTLYPPPILFLHGLWGTSSSLSKIEASNTSTAPWSGSPSAFFSPSAYGGTVAFDASATTMSVLNDTGKIVTSLTSQQIAVGRVDVVAHSMGSLVVSDMGKSGDEQDDSRQGYLDLRAFHDVQRLPDKLPSNLALGTPFRLRLRFPLTKVGGVAVRQFDSLGNVELQNDVPLEASPDGQTYALVTPLLLGKVKFAFNAVFKDHSYSLRDLYAQVGKPTEQPKAFGAYCDIYGQAINQVGGSMEHDGIITPCLVFATAPDYSLTLRKGTTFRVLPGEGAPVIDMHPDGTYTPLRVGRAAVEIGYAGLTTWVEVVIMP